MATTFMTTTRRYHSPVAMNPTIINRVAILQDRVTFLLQVTIGNVFGSGR